MFPRAKLLVFTALLAALAPADALWPQPRSIETGGTPLRLSGGFAITVAGSAPSDLHAAVQDAKSFISNDKLGRLVVGRGAVDVAAYSKAKTLSKLTLSLEKGATAHSITSEAQKAPEARDEAYTLTVPGDGSGATITANSTLGLYRGLTTFTQLFFYNEGTTYLLNAPVHIEDAPAYPYRGFMLDTARNYFPVSDIKRTLDAMSWVKINQFHWHVVDSQSFPLEVPGYPELSQKGAYSASSVYSPGDVADIISYAGARGIDVMLEIDTPGHTSVISKSHPEHVACPEATPWATYANEPPAGQLRLASEATTNFTAGLLAAAAKLSPSTLFSTGGDELNTNCYAADEETQASLNATGKTLEQALNTFTQVTHKALLDEGKTPVVWEEMVLVHNVTLNPETLVLVWISSDDVKAVAEAGFKLIHAASDYFYLDCGGGGWVGDFPDGNSWCDPFKTWQKSYSFDPVANLTDAEAKLVIGGQHLLWVEQSGPENLDPAVWPRAASSAELFWSGPGGNLSTALPRLHEVAYRMRQRGVQAISLQPEWCALRPGACDLTA
ncbi:glycoside hydrolase family 20 protein [Phlebiopsis gigantea 11061_1 CR5-6]|uniref:Beta-hexosaminidase n=1 Tax=Phlebiopsis gigantea (strain 11061_1 CR5-6) TaxID=745531 RepID=A0A0C3PD03_PHLG1|nr:glycoside hydrolase family 20 protein [Phlebiopsis gigantea 11061_1 CR5-6]